MLSGEKELNSRLKPCPFCGISPYIYCTGFSKYHLIFLHKKRKTVHVICTQCNVDMSFTSFDMNETWIEETAISKWNNRHEGTEKK